MCGRYAATRDPARLAEQFDAVDHTGLTAADADYNVAPSKGVVTVVQRYPRDGDGAVRAMEAPVRGLRVMRWGLVPFWAKDPAIGNRMINTRAETATEKPAFRAALARRRCLIPADGWYEWRPSPSAGKKSVKDPFFMTDPSGESLAFAGIWETWRDPNAADGDRMPLITCSVLTTESIGRLTDIHHRMPLLMPAERQADWLDPDRAELGSADELLTPPALDFVDALELRPVSSKVNNTKNNGPELVERVDVQPVDLDQNEPAALFELPNR